MTSFNVTCSAPPVFPPEVAWVDWRAWRYAEDFTWHYVVNEWAFLDVTECQIREASSLSDVYEDITKWVCSCVWASMPGHDDGAGLYGA